MDYGRYAGFVQWAVPLICMAFMVFRTSQCVRERGRSSGMVPLRVAFLAAPLLQWFATGDVHVHVHCTCAHFSVARHMVLLCTMQSIIYIGQCVLHHSSKQVNTNVCVCVCVCVCARVCVHVCVYLWSHINLSIYMYKQIVSYIIWDEWCRWVNHRVAWVVDKQISYVTLIGMHLTQPCISCTPINIT